jgi:hypothetical protein
MDGGSVLLETLRLPQQSFQQPNPRAIITTSASFSLTADCSASSKFCDVSTTSSWTGPNMKVDNPGVSTDLAKVPADIFFRLIDTKEFSMWPTTRICFFRTGGTMLQISSRR